MRAFQNGLGKATNANNRKHHSIISTNLSICVSMRLNAHNLRFLNEKGCHLRIVPRVIYSVTVEPSLLYGIKAILFTTLTESQQVELSAYAPLHLWKPSQSTVGTRTTWRNRSSKTTRSTQKGFGQMVLDALKLL